MRSKLLPLFIFTIFLVPEQFLISQQIKFAAIGDYGKDGPNLQAVADLIDSLEVDFIITTGDNNYNNGAASTIDKNIGKYFNEFIYPYVGDYPPGGSPDSINRFFPSLGNHDYNNTFNPDDAQPYLNYFELPGNERWYTFSQGNVDFFALDSPMGWIADSLALQWSWLQNEVANSTAQWKVVYFHHPPYSSRFSHTRMRLDFISLDIDLVFSGHDHLYERLEIDSLTYIINGLGGKSIYSTNPPITGSVIQYNEKYGATFIDVSETELILKFINIDGELIDSTKLVDSPLPVELVSFDGEYVDNSIILNWNTETESQNYGFDLERRNPLSSPFNNEANQGVWEKIAFVPGNGNSSSPKFYSYTDTDLQSTGVFKYRLKQIDTDGSYDYSNEISVNVNKPNKFLLGQNYPNPFNPNTRIFYSIPAKAFVIINIYDVLGNEVATLINEEKSEGRYEVLFNANGISSGIYYYRMQANEFVDVKKMIILK